MSIEDINTPLIEEKRPPIYTAMKYWGKKPHNIWRTYIERYTPENGIFLDPFTGSAMSAFEAVKIGRKAIAFDLNPLSTFLIEVITSEFNRTEFIAAVNEILCNFDNDEIYKHYFTTESRHTTGVRAIVQHIKWEGEGIYELGVMVSDEDNELDGRNISQGRYIAIPIDEDNEKAEDQNNINIEYWYPDQRFHDSPSFSASFIDCLGGNNFSNLWTRRNLYVISKIFDQILHQSDENIKKQLLFGFIQTIHLCSKMCVPRRPSAGRQFSTSWGRASFICANRKMEMNPLLVYKGSCIGRQSVESCLSSVNGYLGHSPKLVEVSHGHKHKRSAYDLKYGVVDINVLEDYIEKESIDFIMTDPPYGDLVQYFDLSSVWLNWLNRYDSKYTLNFDAEIIIKPGIIDLRIYEQRFTNAIKILYELLKPDGRIVFTFHNKDIKVWNSFLKSIKLAGFKIEKVIFQQNRRTGESNVANPYGTSASDFYIRCIKGPFTSLETDKDKFEHFIITKAIELIALRNEPAPYQILFNGLLAEISSAGFDIEDFDKNINTILRSKEGSVFLVTENNVSDAGDFWWFANPSEHIRYPDKMLTDRVEDSIISILRRKTTVKYDEVLGEIFVKYPNGLTPDIVSVKTILERYATKSGGRWLINSIVENNINLHTRILHMLAEIGRKIGFEIFIGKREQQELNNGGRLLDDCDITDLSHLSLNPQALRRIEMIDMVWLDQNNEINCIFEVENSTNFTSGIQRGSNLHINISKIMVIPDSREREFLNIRDPLFVESFRNQNWKYIFFSEIERIFQSNSISQDMINSFTKDLS